MPLRLPGGDTYLTTQDACNILGVSRSCLSTWRMEDRAPPSISWAGKHIYHRDQLIAWFDAKVQEATQGAEAEETDE
jgi:predicted site-specific integrase-resolvase